jgi:Acyclic terpene utilisation family protein AtuA
VGWNTRLLGAALIVIALAAGANVIMTGRCTDTADSRPADV